jgi:hypothetical protein
MCLCLAMYRVDTQPDVARAIRRSRRARAAMRSRQRRVTLAVGLAVALAGVGTLSVTGVTGSDLAQAAVSRAKSLADLLNARSPGERTQAQLTKTKRAKPLARPRMRPAQHAQAPKDQMVEFASLLTSTPLAVGLERPLPLTAVSPPPSLAMVVTGGGGGGGGGGVLPPTGGDGPVTFPTPQPREVITAPSAVPEPGTWATMLLGFGFIAWQVRRRARPLAGLRNPA